MELAKQHIDIGLFTNNRDAMVSFWQNEVGLTFDHVGKLGGGVHQLRHFLGAGPEGPILKINHARNPLPPLPASGYREILLARQGVGKPRQLRDPDGNRVTLVEPGYLGISLLGLRLGVRNVSAFENFYRHVLELPRAGADQMPTYRLGDSVLIPEESSTANFSEDYRATGYRYITFQITRCVITHQTVLARGALEGMEPKLLGDTVRYSFIRDPDGNYIELSQRASLTGTLQR